MINYSLKCDKELSFDSWFASADAFDKLLSTGMIACVHCGSSDVQKAVMAPRVNNKSTSVQDRSASHPSPAEIKQNLQNYANMSKTIPIMSDQILQQRREKCI